MPAERLREFQSNGYFLGSEPRELTPEQAVFEEEKLSEKQLLSYHDKYYAIGKECLSNYYKEFYPFNQSVFGRELELTFSVKEYEKISEPKFDKKSGKRDDFARFFSLI